MSEAGIMGLNEILNTNNVDNKIDTRELENEISNTYPESRHSSASSYNPIKKYQEGFNDMLNQYGVELSDAGKTTKTVKSRSRTRTNRRKTNRRTNRKNKRKNSNSASSASEYSSSAYSDSDESNSDNESGSFSDISSGYYSGSSVPSESDYSSEASIDSVQKLLHKNSELYKKTNEHKKQKHLQNVMDKMNQSSNYEIFSMDKAEREDQKIRMLEEIDAIRENLEEDGIDVSRVPNVDPESKFEKIESVLRTLQLKNDREQYSNMATELIGLGATGAEKIFDGKREFFGTRPDLTGWSATAQAKLHKMRYDTSNVVGQVVSQFRIPSWLRILLSLIPSAFIHSQQRRKQYGEPTLKDDAGYNDALNSLDGL